MPNLSFFPTQIYWERLHKSARTAALLNKQLLRECYDVAANDRGGIAWSKQNYPNGFTSYASANDMQLRSPTFAKLEQLIRAHMKKYVKALEYDIDPAKLKMRNCWVNVMPANSHHGMHLHPLSVISGTYYVSVPKKSSALKLEDPRLHSFMAMPPKKENCKARNKTFVKLAPAAGSLVLFESWLRHEVPLNTSAEDRVSISFNYDWI